MQCKAYYDKAVELHIFASRKQVAKHKTNSRIEFQFSSVFHILNKPITWHPRNRFFFLFLCILFLIIPFLIIVNVTGCSFLFWVSLIYHDRQILTLVYSLYRFRKSCRFYPFYLLFDSLRVSFIYFVLEVCDASQLCFLFCLVSCWLC